MACLKCILIEGFYFGLRKDRKQTADTLFVEGMLQSSYYQIKTTLDAITNNSQELRDDDLRLQHESRGRTDAGMDRNVIVALQGQVTKMKKLLQSMALSQVDAVGNYVQAVKQVDEMRPVGCGEPHTTDACLLNAEIAAYVKSYPYSNTYNAGWRDHPNFS